MPFILDYRAMGKVIEASALGAVAEKIQNLEKLAAQITSATNNGRIAQMQAEKTSAGAKEIADKMAAEVRQFSEFMQKMNDSEKAALRLEVEKLHRGEAEWLQVLVRILDHVFALHAAAARSGQPKVAEQITQFPKRLPRRRAADRPRAVHRRAGRAVQRRAPSGRRQEEKPPAGAVVAETVGTGYTFQGKLLRPALVRLREKIRRIRAATERPKPPEAKSRNNSARRRKMRKDELPLVNSRSQISIPVRRAAQKMQPAMRDRPRINFPQRAA